ncbi:MAG: hypothetical protein ACI9VR_000245 [Cognaticolwellia sp.]|jgi:hypothetical protein
MFVLLTAATAWPCANLVTSEGEIATSGTQEVIFATVGDSSVVEYRAAYTGDAAEFGWIIALNGEFESLEDGEDDRFETLREHSDPRVIVESVGDDPGSGAGCGAKSGGLRNDGIEGGGDDLGVVAQGFTGNYAYVVLETQDSQTLQDWLVSFGFDAGASQATLDDYMAEGDQFVLISVSPDRADTDGEVGLPPVRIQYKGPLSFPARMARESAASEMATTVYVLGDQRAQVGGWGQVDLPSVYGGEESAEQAWYEALLPIGLEQGYARVYAGSAPAGQSGAFLTRFETRAPTDVHTIDPVFTVDDGQDGLHTEITVWDGGSSEGWLWVPLLGLGLVGLRRRES